ncbi:RidA family protein [Amaricoccus sp.]|uniref:RidA family protein n=1 Tax=Amaricoccus sp. TaxID=1872485 RepID=UPI002623E137|nr:RidA family protein [Amaricoccus sp.]HRO11801.1 RidA family protein [Amaricoccus sp.]
MPSKIDARLAELGITLVDPPAPEANYVPFVVSGSMVYVSGQVSRGPDGVITGKLGAGTSVEAGAAAAATCAHQLLARLRTACGGDLDRVRRVVKLTGFVNSAPDFTQQPQVMNGCSDVLVAVLGEAGRHARSAVGMAALPLGAVIEVEGVFEIA